MIRWTFSTSPGQGWGRRAGPFLLAAVLAPAAFAAGVTLEGRVLSLEGKPLAGATVWLEPAGETAEEAPEVSVRTDEQGRFAVADLAGETFRVFVRAEGHAPLFFREVPRGARLSARLQPGQPLKGRVLDRSSGRPVRAARVRACLEEAWRVFGRKTCEETRSDDEGRFVFPHANTGPTRLEAVATGYAWASRTAPAEAFAAQARWEWFLAPGAAVGGRVLDPAGRSVSDAEVSAVPAAGRIRPDHSSVSRTRTDDTGTFLFEGLPEGRYRLRARKAGLGSAGADLEIVAGKDRSDLELRLSGGAAFRVRLLDPDERPITNVRVELSKGRFGVNGVPREQVEVGEGGTLTVRGLEAGQYDIRLLPASWPGVVRKGLRLEEKKTVDLGTLRVEPGERVAGTVQARDGTPIPEAHVAATWHTDDGPWTRRTSTDAEGRFAFEGIDAQASVKLYAAADGFSRTLLEHVEPGREDLVLVLDPLGAISGEVRLAEGGAPPAFEVYLHPQRKGDEGVVLRGGERTFEDPEGRFVFDDVTPGTYAVEVRASGWAPAVADDVEVRSGETTEIGRVVLERGLTLEGRVLTRDGLPVPGAIVSAVKAALMPMMPARHAATSTTASEDGSFVLEGLRAGVFTVRAAHPDYAEAEVRVEIPPEGKSEPVEIRLGRGGAIAGAVTDASGAPVEGERIFVMRGMFEANPRYGVTDNEGRYRIEGLEPGPYRVSRPGRDQLRSKQAVVREGETTIVNFRDDEGIRLHGTVTRGGRPVAQAKLIFVQEGDASFLSPKMAVTDAEGEYELRVDSAGRYTVMVSEGEGLAKMTRVTLDVPQGPEAVRNISLDELGGIAGRVTDEEGTGLQAQIVAVPEDEDPQQIPHFARTDAGGAYSLSLPAGRYHVSAQAQGFTPEERAGVEITPAGGMLTLDFTLRRGVELRGRVLDPLGQPVAGAIVSAAPSGSTSPGAGTSTQTDTQGEFELPVPPQTSLDLYVVAGGWAPTTLTQVRPDPDEPLVVQLRRGGTIHVRVLTRDGHPLEGAVVRAVPAELAGAVQGQLSWLLRWNLPRPTDLSGETTLAPLAPGRYRLVLEDRETLQPVEVEVREGERSEAAVVAAD